jgi:hypothetical protein
MVDISHLCLGFVGHFSIDIMSQTPKLYKYEPLNYEPEFRLLQVEEILPRTEPRAWKYSIIHTALTIAASFETVSWVWGSGIRDRPLMVDDGTVVYISKNLEEAIPSLSLFCCTGYLWIDQVCIDQDTTSEKNHQVKIMGRIYQKGNRVLVWLRKALASQSDEFDNVCNLFLDLHFLKQEGVLTNLIPKLSNDKVLVEQFHESFSSTWFRRAWVYQEIILPQNSAFILGHVKIPLAVLAFLAQTIKFCTRDVIWTDLPPKQYILHKHAKPNIDRLAMMARDWTIWHGQAQPPNDTVEPFENFLSSVVPDAKVSNDCDAIYAFAGLNRVSTVPEMHYIPIEPNYEYSQRQVFTSVTKAIIESTKELNIFEFLSRKAEHQMMPELFSRVPTWAPDFILREVGTRFSRSCRRPTNALEPVEPREQLFDDLTLTVWGARKDTICEFVVQVPLNWSVSSRMFRNYVKEVRTKWLNTNMPGDAAPNSKDVLLALLLGGHCDVRLIDNSLVPYSTVVETVGKASSLLMDSALMNPDWEELVMLGRSAIDSSLIERFGSETAVKDATRLEHATLNFIQQVCGERSLYTTREGRLAVGRGLQPGDELCILDGCCRPVALREHPSRPGFYGVVETCYLQGYMDPWVENDVTGKAKGGRAYVLI